MHIPLHDGTHWTNQILQGIKLFSVLVNAFAILVGMLVLVTVFEIYITENVIAKFGFILMFTVGWSFKDNVLRKTSGFALIFMIVLSAWLLYDGLYDRGYEDGLKMALEIINGK